MARRTRDSPTIEEIENRIEPDLDSAFTGQDLTLPEDFDLAWNEYFEGHDEILYSQNTKQRTFNVYNDRHGGKRQPANPVLVKKYTITKHGKQYEKFRDSKGKFITKKKTELTRPGENEKG